jgi:hypothetical protein
MKQDNWTHTTTRAEYGTTGALGSPRSWLRRALDTQTLDDTTFQPGSLTPTEISVAGVWYKQPDGYGLPITGMHRELFRYFDIPAPDQMMRPRTRVPLVPAIGVCAAVPAHEILKWIKIYRDHGATYTWWNTPINRAVRATDPLAGKRERNRLDHSEVYRMLDAGKNRTEISRSLGVPINNIDYVIKKWRLGLVSETIQNKPRIDVPALIRDHDGGATATELAVAYATTPAYVYKLINQSKANKCQDLNQL